MNVLTKEAAEDLRDWMREELKSVRLAEEAESQKGNKEESYFSSGMQPPFIIAISVVTVGKDLDSLIHRFTRDIEGYQKVKEKNLSPFTNGVVEGRIAASEEIIARLKGLKGQAGVEGGNRDGN